jgi:hypothetical protein
MSLIPILITKERPMGDDHASVWVAVIIALVVITALGFVFDDGSPSESDQDAHVGH